MKKNETIRKFDIVEWWRREMTRNWSKIFRVHQIRFNSSRIRQIFVSNSKYDVTISISKLLKFLEFLNSERNDRVENRKSFDLSWHVLLLESVRFINLNLHNYYSNQYHIYVCFNFNFWHNNNYSVDRRVV